MLTINPDKVCHIIVKARALDAKAEAGTDDAAGSMIDDDMLEVLDGSTEDATEDELRAFIDGLNVDEQIELVALSWIGRGSFGRDEWRPALAEARHAHGRSSADYLLGMPLLGDYLADGLAEFGHSCDE
jgi:hypothetical protein